MIHAVAILCLAQQPKIHHYEEKKEGKWHVVAEFKELPGKDSLTLFANKDLNKRIKKSYDGFLNQANKEWEPGLDGQQWSYETNVVHGAQRKTMISFAVNTYRYMGGAHGLGVTKTYNYGIVNGKPKLLTLWDVFKKSKRNSLNELILKTAKKDPGTDWLQDDSMPFKGLDNEQLANFWVAKPGYFTWEFAPYELGSYASGPFSFVFASNQLKGLLK
jgi:hypothetical protein